MQNISKRLIVAIIVLIIAIVAGGWFWYASVQKERAQMEQQQAEASKPQAKDIPQWEKDALVEREELGYPALPEEWRLFRSDEYGFEVGYKEEWNGEVMKYSNADSYYFPSGESNPHVMQIFNNSELIKTIKPKVQKFVTTQDLYDTWYLRRGHADEDSGMLIEDEKVRAQNIIDGPKMEGEFAIEELRSGHIQALPKGNYWLIDAGKRIGWYVSNQNGKNYDVNIYILGRNYSYYFSNSFGGIVPYFETILSQFRILN
jgi:hypothetical protein